MKVRVLGPIEVWAEDGPVYLTRRQQRLIVGILAVEANRVVSPDRLIDLMWSDHPPRLARAVIQSRISELRSTLARHGASGLLTRGGGYVLDVDPDLVDIHRFRELTRQAHEVSSQVEACRLLRAALNLWHGPALGGWLPADSHAALCGGIEAARLTAAEDLYRIELELGHYHSSVNEINEIATANLAREHLVALAMTALHHTGRTAEALQLFDRCRRWLADELGVDPGTDLRDVHTGILRNDPLRSADEHQTDASPRGAREPRPRPGPDPGATGFSVAIPHLLPLDVPDFTGRTTEVAQVRERITQPESEGRLVVVSGPAGIGKTALSVHVAHQLDDHFPHGQLYVNLHGADRPGSPTPNEVLARFLRALGVESALPDTLDERAELYRDLLAGRDLLVVLDNAHDADQVRPLLPGSPTCAVLINSRTRLAAAIGGTSMELDVLTEEQAIGLLSRIAGQERIESEPLAASNLVALCGGLPLAVRIAAARLAAKPHWSVKRLAERLTDERKRLDQLAYGDLDVRASIALSYAGMNVDAKCLLGRLGDIDISEVNVWTSAALMDLHPAETEEILDQLHDAQLVDIAGRDTAGYSRYRMHDLVRLFAKEKALSDDTAVALTAARRRALAAWLHLVEVAYATVYGDGSENIRSPAPRHAVDERMATVLTADPLAWFDTERPTIMAMVQQAAKDRQSTTCWGLACGSFSLFEMRRYFDDSHELLNVAMALALESQDDQGRAAVLYRLATLNAGRGDSQQAMAQFQQAAELFERTGDRHGQAIATLHVAIMYRRGSLNDLALDHFHRALTGLRASGDHGAEAFALRNIAQAHMAAGDHETADTHLQMALALSRRRKSRRRETQALFQQGMLRLQQDRHHEAESLFTEVLALSQLLGDRPGQIQAHRGLALCQEKGGDHDRAEATLLAALKLARQPTPTLLETRVRQELARLAHPQTPSANPNHQEFT